MCTGAFGRRSSACAGDDGAMAARLLGGGEEEEEDCVVADERVSEGVSELALWMHMLIFGMIIVHIILRHNFLRFSNLL